MHAVRNGATASGLSISLEGVADAPDDAVRVEYRRGGMWVLCDREPTRRWTKGLATLLGDAAHPMLQYLAQGACMAIEDAGVLARNFVAAEGDFPLVAQRYQDERYLRTGRCQLMARIYGGLLPCGRRRSRTR